MAVVIDYNNVAWSVAVQDIKYNAPQNKSLGIDVNESLVRHILFNTIRSHVAKNRMYGDAIIACDGGSWRYGPFKNYKARRKLAREQAAAEQAALIAEAEDAGDDFDVVMVGAVVEEVREDLKKYFPLKVIHVPGAEGDDVIAVIAEQCRKRNESCRIISADKDFKQLHHDSTFFSTTQYSPTLKKDVTVDDPAEFLKWLILGGDGGDDVPNVLQPDDYFITPKDQRQKTIISAKMKKEWSKHWKDNRLQQTFFDDYNMDLIWGPARARGITASQIRSNYRRNVMCVDLAMIPVHVKDDIESALELPFNGDVAQVMQYFSMKGLNKLVETAGDFA